MAQSIHGVMLSHVFLFFFYRKNNKKRFAAFPHSVLSVTLFCFD